MASFNQVTLIGRLGKEPEMNYTPSGKAVTKFSIAVNQGKDAAGNDKPAQWWDITCWDKLAERMNQWLWKGAQVLVQGRLDKRSYVDNQGVKRIAVDVIATTVELLEKRQAATPASEDEGGPLGDLDDHPF